jgi:hypothetical protein
MANELTGSLINQGVAPGPEQPTFNKGQTGKGVEISGKVTAREGTGMDIGGDPLAGRLKKTWSKAESADSRFGNF